MKRYTMSGAAAIEHTPDHPERTARRNASAGALDFDVTYQVWPSRAAMLTTIQMQDRAPYRSTNWKACRVLTERCDASPTPTQTEGH